jgi:hypothetical protein
MRYVPQRGRVLGLVAIIGRGPDKIRVILRRVGSRCFEDTVVLNAEGLHHLRYSAERERGKPEHVLKFRLLPLAVEVIRKSARCRSIIAAFLCSAAIARPITFFDGTFSLMEARACRAAQPRHSGPGVDRVRRGC